MSQNFKDTKARLENILTFYRHAVMPREAPNSPIAARFDSPLGFDVTPEEIVLEVNELDSKPIVKPTPKPIAKASKMSIARRSITIQAWVYNNRNVYAELLEHDISRPKRKPLEGSSSCPDLGQLRGPVAKGPKVRI